MKKVEERRADRALVREALRMAAQGPDPDLDRLVAAVPRVMAEARRRLEERQRLQKGENPLTAAVPLAARAIPRFAAAALFLALISVTIVVRDAGRAEGDREDLDRALVVGTDAAGVEDLILGAVAPQEDGEG